MQKLEEICWTGQDAPNQLLTAQEPRNSHSTDPEHAGSRTVSPEEEEYGRRYGDLLAAFKGQWTEIDITGSLEPPRDLFIDVRVLKNAGEIQTEYG